MADGSHVRVETRAPRFSVVMPVHNGAAVLPASLGALLNSDLPRDRWELIVVDDASTDGSAALNARADVLIQRPPPARGPAHARNVGSSAARGEWLVFVDADVRLHPDALSRIAQVIDTEPDIAAVFGAYDGHPTAPGLLSQYRNLLHHYVHAHSPGDAETFWAGLGAMRRDVFAAAGGFDAVRYSRPQIEDIELGYRVRAAGHRILLRPEIQGTHLKRWTLRSLVLGDLLDRGIPWMRLWLRQPERHRTGTLNLQTGERVYTALVGAAVAAIVLWAVRREPGWLFGAAGCAAAVLAGNLTLLRWFAERRGTWFALGVVPLRLLYYLLNGIAALAGWIAHLVSGDPCSSAGAKVHDAPEGEVAESPPRT